MTSKTTNAIKKNNQKKNIKLDSPSTEPQLSTSKAPKTRSTNNSKSAELFNHVPAPVKQSAQVAPPPTEDDMGKNIEDDNHEASLGSNDSAYFEVPDWASSQPKDDVASSQTSLGDSSLLQFDQPSTFKVDGGLLSNSDSGYDFLLDALNDSQSAMTTSSGPYEMSTVLMSPAPSSPAHSINERRHSFDAEVPRTPSSPGYNSDNDFFGTTVHDELDKIFSPPHELDNEMLSDISEVIENEVLNEKLDALIDEPSVDYSKTLGPELTFGSQDFLLFDIMKPAASQSAFFTTDIVASTCILESEGPQPSPVADPKIDCAIEEVEEGSSQSSFVSSPASSPEPAPRSTRGRKRKVVVDDDPDFDLGSDIEYSKSPKKSKNSKGKKEQNREAAQRYRQKKAAEVKKTQIAYEIVKAENDKIREKIKTIAQKRDLVMELLFEKGSVDEKFFPAWYLAKRMAEKQSI